jgi:hypothetical protein
VVVEHLLTREVDSVKRVMWLQESLLLIGYLITREGESPMFGFS